MGHHDRFLIPTPEPLSKVLAFVAPPPPPICTQRLQKAQVLGTCAF